MSTDQRSPFSVPNQGTTPLVDPTNVFCAFTLDANGNAILPSAGGSIYGVVYGISTTGNAISARGPGDGKVKVQYGATVTLGASGTALKVNASGQFIPASAGDIAAGAAVALAFEAGSSGEIHPVVLLASASGLTATGGVDDIVLGTTAPSNLTETTYAQTTGTKTGALGAGQFVGQKKRIIQSVAASTPVGTITGTFKTLAGAAATTLALGTAVATIGDFVWDGAAWRATSAITGTGSSLT